MNEKRGVTKATVKALFTYPVKSCRGIELQSSDVVETGLRYDRIFSFAQLLSEADKSGAKKVVNSVTTPTDKWVHSWKFITQRQHPRLALLETELRVPNDVRAPPDSSSELVQSGGCLIVRFPFLPDFNPFVTKPLKSWRDAPEAVNITNEIEPATLAKLKYFLGVSNPLALFRIDYDKRRMVATSRGAPTPEQAGYQPVVAFADGFPLHVNSISTIAQLAEDIKETDRITRNEIKNGAKASTKTTNIERLDPRRFRANIYISGVAPFTEDTWKMITVADTEYSVCCRTARCNLPSTDPTTGIQDPCEPMKSMKRTRVVDGGAKPVPVLGVMAVAHLKTDDTDSVQHSLISVGDEVRVLETGEHWTVKGK